MSSAVVLLSGGLDSTACLLWALRRFDEVHAVGFDYGQRHVVELEAAENIAREAGVSFRSVSIGGLAGSSLTDHSMALRSDGGHLDLPNTMTPGRNGVLLFHALNIAVTLGARHLVTGICFADDAGYPDCREPFRVAIERAMSLAVDLPIEVHAPLMKLSKSDTVAMTVELGGVNLLGLTHTCYEGARPACGRCTACTARLEGFQEAGRVDPVEYVQGIR